MMLRGLRADGWDAWWRGGAVRRWWGGRSMAQKANRNPEMFAHFESLLEVRAQAGTTCSSGRWASWC